MPATAEVAGPAPGGGVTEAAGAAKHARKRTPTGARSALGGRGRGVAAKWGRPAYELAVANAAPVRIYPICTLEPLRSRALPPFLD